ncbi:MAG: tetratricopeptide repeat protein [Cyanobacteria bacterium LVE1205-1]
MGRYPITQAQYEAVMGINPNRRMATIWNGSQWLVDHPIPVQFDGMNKPAIAISFEDTQEFIRKLNQITGKHYRLPTEAEWEFVARAGTTTDYCYGDIITPQVVNFDGTSSPHQPSRATCPSGTLDVNQLYPNPWGLYHIHGNVWEWVEDCWHKNYSGAPTDGSAWIRDGVSEQRVVRGGSWANRYDRARSSYRSQDSSISHFNSNGFRIALSNLWSSSTPIVEAGNSSSSIPMPVVSPTPKQTSSKQSTSSASFPSQSASDYFDSGKKKYNQGDFLGAISDYSEAIRIDPNYAKAYNNRGFAKDKLKDYQGAISDYSEAIRIDPNFAYAYNNRGNAKDELKDYKGAISDYSEAIRIDPNFAYAYNNRGIAKRKLKDYKGAISDYSEAIRIDPNDTDYYYNRGNAKRKLKDYKGAISDYSEAIRIDPNNANAYNNRGDTYELLNENSKAIADFKNAALLFKKNEDTTWFNKASQRIRTLEHGIVDYHSVIDQFNANNRDWFREQIGLGFFQKVQANKSLATDGIVIQITLQPSGSLLKYKVNGTEWVIPDRTQEHWYRTIRLLFLGFQPSSSLIRPAELEQRGTSWQVKELGQFQ